MTRNREPIEAWFDGALNCDGLAAYGYMIAQGDRVIATCGGYLGPGLDSVSAEYAALDALLLHLIITGTSDAIVRGDCVGVIDSVQGKARASSRHQGRVDLILASRVLLPFVTFEWTPRGLNSQAHILASAALKNYATMKPRGDFNHTAQPAKPKKPAVKLRRKARQLLAALIDILS